MGEVEKQITELEENFDAKLIATNDPELINGYIQMKNIFVSTIEMLMNELDKRNAELVKKNAELAKKNIETK